jgi:Uma2 family endonuclease
MRELQTVGPDFDRSWLPAWAKGMPLYKCGEKDPPYTYADWRKMPVFTEEKVELIDGLLIAMPFPTSWHAELEGEIYGQIWLYLRGKKGKVFSSNFGVRLFPGSSRAEDKNCISPDVTVVLDTSKINEEGCQGAPDFVVEILSTNRKEDLVVKLEKYQEAGVGEYWIVDPELHTVQVNILENGKYFVKTWDADKTPKVPVKTLPGLEIDFSGVFAQMIKSGFGEGGIK